MRPGGFVMSVRRPLHGAKRRELSCREEALAEGGLRRMQNGLVAAAEGAVLRGGRVLSQRDGPEYPGAVAQAGRNNVRADVPQDFRPLDVAVQQ